MTKKYGKRQVLDNLTLNIDKGINLILGDNGAGKSTLISIMEGLTKRNSGSINVADYDPAVNSKKVMERVSFIPEMPVLFGTGKIHDFLYLHSKINGYTKETLNYYLDIFGVRNLIHSYFRALSMGERELIMDVAALSAQKEFYVLDEPNSNIDSHKRNLLVNEIKRMNIKNNSSFLMVTHIMDSVLPVSDNTYFLENGKIKYSAKTKHALEDGKKLSIKIRSLFPENIENALAILNPERNGSEIIIRSNSLDKVVELLQKDNLKSITNIEISMGDYN